MKIVLLTVCVLFIGTSTGVDYSLQQVVPVNGLRFVRKGLDFSMDRVPKSDSDESTANELSVKTTTLTAEISFKRLFHSKNVTSNNPKIIFIITIEDERYYIQVANGNTGGKDTTTASSSDDDDSNEDVCSAGESVITTYEVVLQAAKSSSNSYKAEGQVIKVECSAGISYHVNVTLDNIKTSDTFSISGHGGYGNGKQYSHLLLESSS